MSRNIPEKETRALIALSGGVCAFPGCNKRLVEPGNPKWKRMEKERMEKGVRNRYYDSN